VNRRRPWKSGLSRPAVWSATSIFVESIFGNGGDPYLPENDAGLDAAHWTGPPTTHHTETNHTGCVVLAPHLVGIRKKALGLPHAGEATQRQRRDGMCWTDEDEPYNGGRAFKVACRMRRGVMVTLIADNLLRVLQEGGEDADQLCGQPVRFVRRGARGRCAAFATYVLDRISSPIAPSGLKAATFADVTNLLGELIARRRTAMPSTGVFRTSTMCLRTLPSTRGKDSSGAHGDADARLALRAEDVYVLPSGYAFRLQKQVAGTAWRLVGSRRAELCAISRARCPAVASPNFQIDRRCSAEGIGFRERLPRGHGAGGGGSGGGFFRHLSSAAPD